MRTAFAAMLVVATLPAMSQSLRIEGGALDCGEWAYARKKDNAVAYEHYLLGVLNGLTLGRQQDFWGAGGAVISREAAYLWMDGYCRGHPLSAVITGAVELFNERAPPIRLSPRPK